ncbi:hypothetical protein BS50DRAFT_406106 [Corynespora cassiicola Philippines]|uniref:Uncharacterized protein n=1 Tax=Corynespora cassiicola Philippines TaxID=1448308 RepID=A0A2T2NKW9_CORCC|nr:hypothetical protein BS50DRAFT_406106 [Corynespora cassiicola Philippines]
MKPPSLSSTSAPTTRSLAITLPGPRTASATFTFNILPKPPMVLSFAPRPSPPRPRKRPRAAADVDGEHSCLYKKKRRLRLFLITSRLSPQFSHPATNIVDRGNSKIAVWAKQKALGRNLLRKAAILNRIRRRTVTARKIEPDMGRMLVEQEREQKQLQMAQLTLVYGDHDTSTRPVIQTDTIFPPTCAVRKGNHFELSGPSPPGSPSRTPPSSPPLKPHGDGSVSEYRSPNDAYSYSPPRTQAPRKSYLPLPPSPLGLSNYAALDIEDDVPDPYANLDDDEEEQGNDMWNYPLSPSTTSSASHSCASSTNMTSDMGHSRTPPQSWYADYGILDPGEPVVGDYDQVDEGADAVWPSSFVPQPEPPTGSQASSSPDFPALFATSKEVTGSVSPNFTSAFSHADCDTPRSPNFTAVIPTSHSTPRSPNFTAAIPAINYDSSRSPNLSFAVSTVDFDTPQSPNFAPVVYEDNETPSPPEFTTDKATNEAAPSQSPNFVPHTNLGGEQLHIKPWPHSQRHDSFTRRDSDIDVDLEKERQRMFMFMPFGS